MSSSRQEVIIIGSGLGGLVCGVILAKEGYRVTILEKNKQIGGMLQIFVRDRVIFDTGIHYVGGLDEGQNLNILFRYLGIMDKVRIRRMAMDCFDAVMLDGDPVVYRFAQGYENFVQQMLQHFPGEEAALRAFCKGIQDVCSSFPLYSVSTGTYLNMEGAHAVSLLEFLESLTTNRKLVSVLAGSSLLYAGEPDKAPLSAYALIINHYLESSWKFVDGGSQIARYLSQEITKRGGQVIRHAHVTKVKEESGKVIYAECKDGRQFKGDVFISNVHPAQTLQMTETDLFRGAYRNRVARLENTISFFYANVVMRERALPYLNTNLYVLEQNDAWCGMQYNDDNWPQSFAIFYSATSRQAEYAEGVTIMAYMRYDEVKTWADTFNTVDFETIRGTSYAAFKERKAQQLFDAVERRIPGFRTAIKSYTTATPLTARDYIGTDDGSIYGIARDYREPLRSKISPRTKIPNLLLTGQNVNMHGVLGVTLSAVVTCSQLLGMDTLIDKIRKG
ncbi:MAG TPA: NAD(P)/FAD-dependent oxidoreductase, partial [Chryseolinea sp.]|nr:NAD(P)/FAD-dependent oxidoreductase [Chryseolinea sp.]